MRGFLAAGCLCLTGCVPYADFTLPPLPGSLGKVQYEWTVSPAPVLSRGPAGAWDSVDTLNPSVLFVNGTFLNLYSGFDGKTWHTGIASSPDGLVWTRRGRILSPDPQTWEGDYIAANGAVLQHRNQYLYWYQAARLPRIGLALSADTRRWSKHPKPVLDPGPRGSWDERGVADPYVVRAGDWLYMYYLGQDRARRQRLGVARSADGINWVKYRGNPVLDLGEPGRFDETGLGEPAVWADESWYWMLYTARDRKEERRLGLARSRDGVAWERVTPESALSGDQDWNAKVVCDPHVLSISQPYRVWFGGGNKAEPAENLSGQIGHATLKLSVLP